MVYKIIEGTPAADSGLQENDKLIAVNGKKVVGLKPDAVYEMLDGDEGDLVTIEYEREGEPREVQIELEDLTKLKDE